MVNYRSAATRQGFRGKVLEQLLDMTHKQYMNSNRASIIRQNPEVTVLNMRGNQIVKGFYKEKGAPDYIGIGDGRVIIFDAKESRVERFELKNLHDHQFDELKRWHMQGATAFLIVSFAHRNEDIYLLPFEMLAEAWEGYLGNGRKSIPYATFVEKCDKVISHNGYVLDYLHVLQKNRRKE